MQSVFCPAARRPVAGIATSASSPRRWTKNGVDETAARALGSGDGIAGDLDGAVMRDTGVVTRGAQAGRSPASEAGAGEAIARNGVARDEGSPRRHTTSQTRSGRVPTASGGGGLWRSRGIGDRQDPANASQALDDDQVPLVTGGADPPRDRGERPRLIRSACRTPRGGRGRTRRRPAEPVTAACERLSAVSMAEEAVRPNPVEARREHVKKNTTNNLRGGQRHRLLGGSARSSLSGTRTWPSSIEHRRSWEMGTRGVSRPTSFSTGCGPPNGGVADTPHSVRRSSANGDVHAARSRCVSSGPTRRSVRAW